MLSWKRFAFLRNLHFLQTGFQTLKHILNGKWISSVRRVEDDLPSGWSISLKVPATISSMSVVLFSCALNLEGPLVVPQHRFAFHTVLQLYASTAAFLALYTYLYLSSSSTAVDKADKGTSNDAASEHACCTHTCTDSVPLHEMPGASGATLLQCYALRQR